MSDRHHHTRPRHPRRGQGPHPQRPCQHQQNKPVRLLALDDGPQGKTALLEFPEGWRHRIVALPTQADAWHPLFDDLTNAERGRLRAHVDHPVIRHPDGTRTKQGALSFVTKEISRVGSWTGERCFDVPAEDYYSGSVTGYRCAAELLDALARGYGPHIIKQHVIKAALQASDEPYRQAITARCGTAFMEVIEGSPDFHDEAFQAQRVHGRKVAEVERLQATMAELEAKEKAAFVERMKAGRAAKRNRAAAGAPQIADA